MRASLAVPPLGVTQLPVAPASTTSFAAAPQAKGPSNWMPIADKYVLIAGCRDEELSYEYSPPDVTPVVNHGALTWFLTQALRQAHKDTTYRDVFERARTLLT